MRTVRMRATAGLVLVTFAVAGCSTRGAPARRASSLTATPVAQPQALPGPSSPSPVRVSVPQRAAVSYQNPTAVAEAAVITSWTMTTGSDTSQYQAELRAAPFLTPAYLAALKASPPVAAPGAQWTLWASRDAQTTVSAVPEAAGQPADTGTTADRQFGITVTPHGDNGWTGAPVTATVFVTLARAGPGQPWLVSGIQVSQ